MGQTEGQNVENKGGLFGFDGQGEYVAAKDLQLEDMGWLATASRLAAGTARRWRAAAATPAMPKVPRSWR